MKLRIFPRSRPGRLNFAIFQWITYMQPWLITQTHACIPWCSLNQVHKFWMDTMWMKSLLMDSPSLKGGSGSFRMVESLQRDALKAMINGFIERSIDPYDPGDGFATMFVYDIKNDYSSYDCFLMVNWGEKRSGLRIGDLRANELGTHGSLARVWNYPPGEENCLTWVTDLSTFNTVQAAVTAANNVRNDNWAFFRKVASYTKAAIGSAAVLTMSSIPLERGVNLPSYVKLEVVDTRLIQTTFSGNGPSGAYRMMDNLPEDERILILEDIEKQELWDNVCFGVMFSVLTALIVTICLLVLCNVLLVETVSGKRKRYDYIDDEYV
ncbi:unnamed protein product [Amoebophrya sp. A120]|nr:unnamed protein product [Amoebophrya sp. A120]|eukprot:GSA120T00011787001.1